MQREINIHLIDDDQTFTFLTRKIIASTGFATRIVGSADGQEAIGYLNDQISNKNPLPDLILLDLSMPIMDGWEFLEEYSSLDPQIKKKTKLYIVSSSISPHDVERAKSYSAVKDFLVKPIRKDKLTEIFQSLSL